VPQANRDSAENFADEFERQMRINGVWQPGIVGTRRRTRKGRV